MLKTPMGTQSPSLKTTGCLFKLAIPEMQKKKIFHCHSLQGYWELGTLALAPFITHVVGIFFRYANTFLNTPKPVMKYSKKSTME